MEINERDMAYKSQQEQELRKALDTSVGTTGDVLIPEIVSEGLRRFVLTRTPITAAVRKIDWPTNLYMWRELNAITSAAFRADGGTLPAADESNYEMQTRAMKYIYARGEVTGPMIAASGSLVNALQLEIANHGDGLARVIEQKMITGSETSDPLEFDGLLEQITTNVHDGTSTILTLSDLDEALDLPDEYPSNIILARAMGRRVWSLLQAQQRFVDRVTVEGGFRVPSYNDLPILRVDNGMTGLTTTVVCPDLRHVVLAVNQDVTYEPLAKTKDSEDFMLKMYLTLAVEGEALYHAKLINVTAS